MIDIFPISFAVGLIFIFSRKFLNKFQRPEKKQPQNLHKKSVSRFGGAAIFISLFLVTIIDQTQDYDLLRTTLLCSFIAFIMGFLDDFRITLPPVVRLGILFPSSLLAYILLDIQAYDIGIPIFDFLFDYKLFSTVFICIALSGIVNAFNMIDGINGLVLTYVLTICISTLTLSQNYLEGQTNLLFVALFFSCLGIYVLNFPSGRIFLGDGGAYFLGMAVSIALIKHYQENSFSPWYVMCILIYPVTDTFATIFRRLIEKTSALEPDNRHFHHMFYLRFKKSKIKSEKKLHILTSSSLFILYTPFVVGANIFPKDTNILIFLCITFVTFYILMYLLLAPKDLKIIK
tara:strand:- start:362 stop:1399 length:1038 start_codon:yes stop_codon:yes gene_type:complete